MNELPQGPETDMTKVDKLCQLSQKGYATSMVVTNKNKKVCRRRRCCCLMFVPHALVVCRCFFCASYRQASDPDVG